MHRCTPLSISQQRPCGGPNFPPARQSQGALLPPQSGGIRGGLVESQDFHRWSTPVRRPTLASLAGTLVTRSCLLTLFMSAEYKWGIQISTSTRQERCSTSPFLLMEQSQRKSTKTEGLHKTQNFSKNNKKISCFNLKLLVTPRTQKISNRM